MGGLGVAVEMDPAGIKTGPGREGKLPARRYVARKSRLGQQSQHWHRRECLRSEMDIEIVGCGRERRPRCGDDADHTLLPGLRPGSWN